MFLGPSLSDGSQELLFVGSHLVNQCLIAGLFVARGPQDHFRKHGSKINSFGGQRIDHFSAIRRISVRVDDSVGFQPAQSVRQNIGGDFLVRVQKFVERLVAAEHHVAQDQERPAVPKHLYRSIQRASGTALRRRFLFMHKSRVAIFTCILQVRLADCLPAEKWELDIFLYRNVL